MEPDHPGVGGAALQHAHQTGVRQPRAALTDNSVLPMPAQKHCRALELAYCCAHRNNGGGTVRSTK